MGISTHILDTTRGRPAQGVTVRLEQLAPGGAAELARGVTNEDGRVKPLLDVIPAAGAYRLHFEVAPYFAGLGVESFYPSVSIDFVVRATHEHYHVPLLLNPYGYATYRGS
ncbi:MAG: hydroxyisourate hydrolase [Myxococcaceae bacterium]|nr:hydroxyisourate hydrolase [Myxococcaceae bacterium]